MSSRARTATRPPPLAPRPASPARRHTGSLLDEGSRVRAFGSVPARSSLGRTSRCAGRRCSFRRNQRSAAARWRRRSRSSWTMSASALGECCSSRGVRTRTYSCVRATPRLDAASASQGLMPSPVVAAATSSPAGAARPRRAAAGVPHAVPASRSSCARGAAARGLPRARRAGARRALGDARRKADTDTSPAWCRARGERQTSEKRRSRASHHEVYRTAGRAHAKRSPRRRPAGWTRA